MSDRKCGTGPMVVDETPGKKAYCQCGLSAKMPYCDGAHSSEGSSFGPHVCEVAEAGKKAVCVCYRSGRTPWCDGAHANG